MVLLLLPLSVPGGVAARRSSRCSGDGVSGLAGRGGVVCFIAGEVSDAAALHPVLYAALRRPAAADVVRDV